MVGIVCMVSGNVFEYNDVMSIYMYMFEFTLTGHCYIYTVYVHFNTKIQHL